MNRKPGSPGRSRRLTRWRATGRKCGLLLAARQAGPAVLFLLAGVVRFCAVEDLHNPVDLCDLGRGNDRAIQCVDGFLEVPATPPGALIRLPDQVLTESRAVRPGTQPVRLALPAKPDAAEQAYPVVVAPEVGT